MGKKSSAALEALRAYMQDRPANALLHDDFLSGYDAGYSACLCRMLDHLELPVSDAMPDEASTPTGIKGYHTTSHSLPLSYIAREVPVNG